MFNRTWMINSLRIVTILILLFTLGMVPGTRAAGLIIYVDANAGGANNGTSWTDAFTDLQAALAAAASGDEIWVAEGIYKPTAISDQTISFQLKSGVGIYGGFTGAETSRGERNSDPATNNTILSGDIGLLGDSSDNSHTVVSSDTVDGTAVLDGFTIREGNANGSKGLPHPERSGGGMHNDDASPTLMNLILTANQANWGGGMLNNNSSPTLNQVTFEGNTAHNAGGAIYNKSSSPVFGNTLFMGNTAVTGGAVYNDASSPSFSRAAFSANQATGNGGGIYNTNSNPLLVNITFQGDIAAGGAGIYNSNSNSFLTNVTFAGETALNGAAIYNIGSSPVLTNLTLSGNVADFGGGLYNDNSFPVVQNTILWGNTDSLGASAAAQIYNINGSVPTITNSLVQGSGGSGPGWVVSLGTDGGNNLDLDPLFIRNPHDGGDGWGVGGNDDYGDLRLQTTSQAINAGENSLLPADLTDLDADDDTLEMIPYDLNDHPRILDSLVDMGAFEVHNEPPTIGGTQAGQTTDDKNSLDPFMNVTIEDFDGNELTVVVVLDDAAKGVLTNLGSFVEGPAGTYTFIGSPAAATAAIRALTFDPTENRVPVGDTETTTFTISAEDGVSAPASDNNTTVIVTSVNDPPSISGTVSGQTIDDKATLDPFASVTLADLDGDTLTIAVSLDDPAKGQLINLGGFTEGPAGTYTYTGSPAQATTAIRGLTFDPAENRVPVGDTETTTFTISANDGMALPVTDNATTVVVTSINDPPTITGTVSGQTVDDIATIEPFDTVTIADVDGNTLTISVALDDAAKGTLTNLGGFTEGPAGTYTFTGTPTQATTALRGLTFNPTDDRVPVGESEDVVFIISADDSHASPVLEDVTVTVEVVEKTYYLYLPLIFR